MKSDELIKDMYKRFTIIVSGLKVLGKKLSNKGLVNKIYRSISKSREAKLIVIEEKKTC